MMDVPGSLYVPTVLGDSLLDWLLGLTRVSSSNARAELGWRFDLPGSAWFLIVVVAIIFAYWSYSRLLGPRWARITLAAARTVLLIFVAALLAGPMLVVRDELVEPDWLIMLVDRSASMGIKDAAEGGGDAGISNVPRVTRNESLRRAFAAYPDLFGDEKLGRDRRILWLGFHGGTYEIDDPVTQGIALPTAEGQSTALRTAIEQALQRAAGRPISGVVLFTDGRSHESTGPELVRVLKGVNVYPVPLGSESTPMNLSIAQINAPRKAFIDDIVPVTVEIDRFPADASIDPARVVVRLIDPQTGETLAEETAEKGGLDKPVRLKGRSKIAGPTSWKVEVEYVKSAAATDGPDELLTEDNVGQVNIELIDRPLRVLYVEGYPRWEYRYLKHMLIREKSIESSLMLISADPSFAQEGDRPITRLPETVEEIEPYDVIIIGDVPSDYFSDAQITLMRDHVSARGGGLLWIAGGQSTPRSYDATPLAELLPMRSVALVEPINNAFGPISLEPTPLATELNVLRLRDSGAAATQTDQWPANLPNLLWAQNLGELKQLAEPLAVAKGANEEDVLPLVVRLRYGAGQSVYVGTDDIWRWRLGRGNLFIQQFWIQLVQMLGKSRIQQHDERVWLEVSHRRVELDQPEVVTLHIKDQLLIKRDLPRIEVGVYREDADGVTTSQPIERIELLPKRVDRDGSSGAAREQLYETVWRPSESGRLVLRVIDAALSDMDIQQRVEVVRPDDEMRDPATDHDRLKQLAADSGGEVVALNELDKLQTLVRYHTRRTPNDNPEPLWDSPLALLVVVLLLTFEWIGRKLIRLV